MKLFTKKGQWEQARDVLGEKGEIVEFAVYQENGWKIGTIIGEGLLSSEAALRLGNILYIHPNAVSDNPPVGYGWTSVGFGVDPAPTCRLISRAEEGPQQITVVGCGIQEVNGVYKRQLFLDDDEPA